MDPYLEKPITDIRILDRTTGVVYTPGPNWRVFPMCWWVNGNGSCDCNRALACGVTIPSDGTCIGCTRFLIVLPDGTPRAGWNDDYEL